MKVLSMLRADLVARQTPVDDDPGPNRLPPNDLSLNPVPAVSATGTSLLYGRGLVRGT